MQARVTTLEVRTEYIEKSIDRLDRSINEIRTDIDKRFIHLECKMDHRFYWMIGIQISSLIAMMSFVAKATNMI